MIEAATSEKWSALIGGHSDFAEFGNRGQSAL